MNYFSDLTAKLHFLTYFFYLYADVKEPAGHEGRRQLGSNGISSFFAKLENRSLVSLRAAGGMDGMDFYGRDGLVKPCGSPGVPWA